MRVRSSSRCSRNDMRSMPSSSSSPPSPFPGGGGGGGVLPPPPGRRGRVATACVGTTAVERERKVRARADIHPRSCPGGRLPAPPVRLTPHDLSAAPLAYLSAHFRWKTLPRRGERPSPSALRMDSFVKCYVRPASWGGVPVARGVGPTNHAPVLPEHVRRFRRQRRFPSHEQPCLPAIRLVS